MLSQQLVEETEENNETCQSGYPGSGLASSQDFPNTKQNFNALSPCLIFVRNVMLKMI
jgi:hypothetical protein